MLVEGKLSILFFRWIYWIAFFLRNCYLGTCQTDGTCLCPQDYQLNAAGTNCEPVANCPYYSVVVLPNLCQCIGQSYYSAGACVGAPVSSTSPAATTTAAVTTGATATTSNASSSGSSTTLDIFSSTTSGQCTCDQIASITQQIIGVIQSM